MEELWPLLAVAAIALVGVGWFLRRKPPVVPARSGKRGSEGLDTLMAWHPQSTRIMTAHERQAFRLLRSALPDHVILAQVPLARFIKVPTRHSYAEWLRRVGQLCADLVVCDADSQVLGIVEVRAPKGQESEKSQRRHARMDRVLQTAGIPLQIWTEGELPSPMAVRESFAPVAGLSTAAGAGRQTPEGRAADMPARPGAAPGQAFEPTEADEDWPQEQDPPPSTWFDDLDSGQVPLDPSRSTTAAPGRTRER